MKTARVLLCLICCSACVATVEAQNCTGPVTYPVHCGRSCGDFDNNGCTDVTDHLIMLDGWGVEYFLEDLLALSDNWGMGPACTACPIEWYIYESSSNTCQPNLYPPPAVNNAGANFRVVITFPPSVLPGTCATISRSFTEITDSDSCEMGGFSGTTFQRTVDLNNQVILDPWGFFDVYTPVHYFSSTEGCHDTWQEHVFVSAGSLVCEMDNVVDFQFYQAECDGNVQSMRYKITYTPQHGNTKGGDSFECVQSVNYGFPCNY